MRVDGADITVMTHPRQVVPTAGVDTWTPMAVADAFDRTLHGYLQPLGLADQEYG